MVVGVVHNVPGTRLSWKTLGEWLDLVFQVGSIPRCSTRHYERCARLYGSLGLNDILICSDTAVLDRAIYLFDRARYSDVPFTYGLGRVWSREILGTLLVEARNRLDAVRSGRAARPRIKGPRLDPRRLPDSALEHLIQTHRDLSVVDRLRAERRRRQFSAIGEAMA